MNAMLSLKWKEALKQSEEQNVVCPSQAGSRKQRSSQFSIHIEILTRNIQSNLQRIWTDQLKCQSMLRPNPSKHCGNVKFGALIY
jgi:hypothetical protein